MKKTILTLSLILAVISISAFVFTQFAFSAEMGDLIKKAGSDSLYYLGADGKRHTFPSDREFFSWYDDFSEVKIIDEEELINYPLGKNVPLKPGTKLVQAVTQDSPWQIADPKVYAVGANMGLQHITSPEIAVELFGAEWESYIVPVVETIFVGYYVNIELTDASNYDRDQLLENVNTINTALNLDPVSCAGPEPCQ